MPDEIVVDLNHSAPQPMVRPMSPEDATALAAAQSASLAQQQADDTRKQQLRAQLLAFMQNSNPTAADAITALKAVIRVLARDLG